MKATTASKSEPTRVSRLLQGLAATRWGREALTAADEAEARLQERRDARAKLAAVEAAEARIPELLEAVKAAEARYTTETARLLQALQAARAEYQAVAGSASAQRSRAEHLLRSTADPLVHESGPVVRALLHAIERTRPFLAGAEDARRLLATESRFPVKFAEAESFAQARRIVDRADRAGESLRALEEALEAVRALQFAEEVDPAAVRLILTDICPDRAPDGTPYHLLDAVAEPAPATR